MVQSGPGHPQPKGGRKTLERRSATSIASMVRRRRGALGEPSVSAPAIASADQARCVWPVRALLGEGPIYDARDDALYFVDIKGMQLHRHALRNGAQSSWPMP